MGVESICVCGCSLIIGISFAVFIAGIVFVRFFPKEAFAVWDWVKSDKKKPDNAKETASEPICEHEKDCKDRGTEKCDNCENRKKSYFKGGA